MTPMMLRVGCAQSLALLALSSLPMAPLLLRHTDAGGQAATEQLPASTSARARELFGALLAATEPKAEERVRSFDLTFEGRAYSGEKQTNDFDARYLYLAPGYVRMDLASGRQRMRGDEGDFLVDKSGVYKLKGRDYAQDVRELDDTVAVSRLFIGLSDPRKLRIESLAVMPAPPAGLPAGSLAEQAAGLDWLVLHSPDFHVQNDKGAPTLDRVQLGLTRDTHLPVMATVTHGGDELSAVLARLEDYQTLDGYRVPWKVTTWRVAEGQVATGPAGPRPSRPLAFDQRPAVKLWLKKGRLGAPLTPKDFLPPS